MEKDVNYNFKEIEELIEQRKKRIKDIQALIDKSDDIVFIGNAEIALEKTEKDLSMLYEYAYLKYGVNLKLTENENLY